MKRLVRDEKGYVLILALIVLVVVGLICAPLLSYMVSGLKAGHVDEVGAAELYGADSGVEDAILKLQDNVSEVRYLYCGNGNHSWTYPSPLVVNGKPVAVTITWVQNVTNGAMYCINSTATSSGSETKVAAYVAGVSEYGNYSGLLNYVIDSLNGYTIRNGNVNYPPANAPNGTYPAQNWPPASVLNTFYWAQVENGVQYSTPIDLAGNAATLQTGYVNGPLTIKNSDNKNTPTLTLNGTLYVTGDTQIAYGTSKNFPMTLNLNGNTIFVESTTSNYALYIGANCNIKGPGVLIAEGGIYFKPNSQVGTAPVFVLSVWGTTLVQPGGSIYGAVAGNVTVTLQPGTNLTYPTGGFGSYNLNFPNGTQQLVYSIISWQVSRH